MGRPSGIEERSDELRRIEDDEIPEPLADPDELDSQAELGTDRQHDPTLCRPIQL